MSNDAAEGIEACGRVAGGRPPDPAGAGAAPAHRWRMRPRTAVLALALAPGIWALTAAANAGELFRCGSWVVSAEMSVAELKQKCGEPTQRTTETQDVRARSAGGGTVRTGTTIIERWVYERSRSLTLVVTITDGVITAMETMQ
ncbi:MAG: DUF2845 domain-containing protein [Gammaproteobacteria bacterium]|nr:DUF2845 domain-containing protein [Gammaproteobacteria bacterium]